MKVNIVVKNTCAQALSFCVDSYKDMSFFYFFFVVDRPKVQNVVDAFFGV